VSRILLIEDDQGTANYIRLALRLEGYTVETVESREAALELVAAGGAKPDVVVMDYLMPGLDAETFLMRARDAGYEGKVILCTGFDKEYELPVDAIVKKPFEPNELTTAIESLIGPTQGERPA
jgi:DNA-binding response OmpR family regulator